jgi:uncharacterized repeat protein (TIGR03803 family)
MKTGKLRVRKFFGWRIAGAVFLVCAATAIASPAQTFVTLANFDGTDGANPEAALVQATNGEFYGTTSEGGANGDGTVFKITLGGKLTVLHSFGTTDGEFPAGLVQAPNGDFYGTTELGGANGGGTVFKITGGGTLTTLHSFDGGADGGSPFAGLVQASNGDFYGTTVSGGANGQGGTIFKITGGGKLTTLYNFCSKSDCKDGFAPSATLVQATDGNFYGTTVSGGANGQGTVFKITGAGKLTTLHSFATGGAKPEPGALVQATDGDFYGTTELGGANGIGTVFKITSKGTLTTLHSFAGVDGANPEAGLVQATNGEFYGITNADGANGDGTIFKITSKGTLTTLHSFDLTDGFAPVGGLVQATNGKLYGTTSSGGANSDGTIFRLSVGLGPFVETRPTSGKVGAAVIILGTDLTGATSVTFNGVAATYNVVTDSEIKTTVPTGATSGKVKVMTPNGTLTSNLVFRVKP